MEWAYTLLQGHTGLRSALPSTPLTYRLPSQADHWPTDWPPKARSPAASCPKPSCRRTVPAGQAELSCTRAEQALLGYLQGAGTGNRGLHCTSHRRARAVYSWPQYSLKGRNPAHRQPADWSLPCACTSPSTSPAPAAATSRSSSHAVCSLQHTPGSSGTAAGTAAQLQHMTPCDAGPLPLAQFSPHGAPPRPNSLPFPSPIAPAPPAPGT